MWTERSSAPFVLARQSGFVKLGQKFDKTLGNLLAYGLTVEDFQPAADCPAELDLSFPLRRSAGQQFHFVGHGFPGQKRFALPHLAKENAKRGNLFQRSRGW